MLISHVGCRGLRFTDLLDCLPLFLVSNAAFQPRYLRPLNRSCISRSDLGFDDKFIAEWTGHIFIENAGGYMFGIASDEGYGAISAAEWFSPRCHTLPCCCAAAKVAVLRSGLLVLVWLLRRAQKSWRWMRNLSGNEVHYTSCSLLVFLKNLCNKLQKLSGNEVYYTA